jgi:hypothetical protein
MLGFYLLQFTPRYRKRAQSWSLVSVSNSQEALYDLSISKSSLYSFSNIHSEDENSDANVNAYIFVCSLVFSIRSFKDFYCSHPSVPPPLSSHLPPLPVFLLLLLFLPLPPPFASPSLLILFVLKFERIFL